MKRLGFALVGGYAGFVLGISDAAMAQARLAPPNPQQVRCIEAFADTPEEKAMQEAIGEPTADVRKKMENAEGWEGLEALLGWAGRRAIEVFGSEDAARAAGERIRIEKYTRRFELLRQNAKEGHLPSLYLLASHPTTWKELEGIPGLPTSEESSAAYRTLHDYGFPLAPRMMAISCFEELENIPEPIAPQPPRLNCKVRGFHVDPGPYGADSTPPDFCTDAELAEYRLRQQAQGDAHEAQVARHRAETAAKRDTCLDLLREGGFRGDAHAWETLSQYDRTTGATEVGIVPPVEHYAWLELERLWLREFDAYPGADEHSVPRAQQEDLARDFMNDEERGEALALAKRYVQVVWPRRIVKQVGPERDCRLLPQFPGDPDPYGSDPSPR